jgi:hypothetical protein
VVQCEYPSNWLGKVQGACGRAHRAADANQQWIAQQIAKPAQRMAHRAGGLERLAANDLSVRLPDFDLAELSRINDVFNHFANCLEFTLAERNELAKRLIAVQDEERQTLARELHDEFGQCLAAISAMAAAIGQTAQVDCPALMPECGLGWCRGDQANQIVRSNRAHFGFYQLLHLCQVAVEPCRICEARRKIGEPAPAA